MNENKNNIKVEGEFHKFGDAVRYTKNKGRFDLIPLDVFEKLVIYANNNNSIETDTITMLDIVNKINGGISRGDYIATLYNLAIIPHATTPIYISKKDYFCYILPTMMMHLALHFQHGAEKYGPRNCERGIPLWSFIDSGMRHWNQYLLGRTDEDHYIAAVWNFWMAKWTEINHPERCGPDVGDNFKASHDSDVTTDHSSCCDNNKTNIEDTPSEKTELNDIMKENKAISDISIPKVESSHNLSGRDRIFDAFRGYFVDTMSFITLYQIYQNHNIYRLSDDLLYILHVDSKGNKTYEKFVRNTLKALHVVFCTKISMRDFPDADIREIFNAHTRLSVMDVISLAIYTDEIKKVPTSIFVNKTSARCSAMRHLYLDLLGSYILKELDSVTKYLWKQIVYSSDFGTKPVTEIIKHVLEREIQRNIVDGIDRYKFSTVTLTKDKIDETMIVHINPYKTKMSEIYEIFDLNDNIPNFPVSVIKYTCVEQLTDEMTNIYSKRFNYFKKTFKTDRIKLKNNRHLMNQTFDEYCSYRFPIKQSVIKPKIEMTDGKVVYVYPNPKDIIKNNKRIIDKFKSINEYIDECYSDKTINEMYQTVDNPNIPNSVKRQLIIRKMRCSKLGICVLKQEYDFTSLMNPGEFMVLVAGGDYPDNMVDFFNKHPDVGISGPASSVNSIVYGLSRDTIQDTEFIKFAPCGFNIKSLDKIVQVYTYIYMLMIDGKIDIKWIKRNICRSMWFFYREYEKEIKEMFGLN